jgi:hypothetical protein
LVDPHAHRGRVPGGAGEARGGDDAVRHLIFDPTAARRI